MQAGTPLPGYAAQTALFLLASWFVALGAGFPEALGIPMWFTLLVVPPLAVSAMSCADPNARWGSLTPTLITAVGCMTFVVLPVMLYCFADGFWPQVFGTVPLLATFAGYALLHAPLARLLVLGLGIVSLRYAYALNVADLCVAVALCCVLEIAAFDIRGWARRLAVLLGCASALLAVFAYAKVAGILDVPGGIRPVPPAPWITGLDFVAAGLLGAARIAREPAMRRLTLCAGAFVLCGAVVMTAILVDGRSHMYYFSKYAFGPAVAAGLVAAVAGAWLVRETIQPGSRARRFTTLACLACLAVGLLLLHHGTVEYRATLWSQAGLGGDAGPSRLFDPRTVKKIKEVMAARQGATFSSMVAPSAPESFMTSSILWRPKSMRHNTGIAQNRAHAGAIATEVDESTAPQCVFWYDLGSSPQGNQYAGEIRETLQALRRFGSCDEGGSHLCYACMTERRVRLSLPPQDSAPSGFPADSGERRITYTGNEFCLLRVHDPAALQGRQLQLNGTPLALFHPQTEDFFRLPRAPGGADGGTLRLARSSADVARRAAGPGIDLTLHCFSASPSPAGS
jgi:hypothetical protein